MAKDTFSHDLAQTALQGAIWSGSTLFAIPSASWRFRWEGGKVLNKDDKLYWISSAGKPKKGMLPFIAGERGGSVVECRTSEREVRGSRPTSSVLCPWARHFTPRKYWLITQEAMAPSRHDWKIVDWDVKPQHNQPTFHFKCRYNRTLIGALHLIEDGLTGDWFMVWGHWKEMFYLAIEEWRSWQNVCASYC